METNLARKYLGRILFLVAILLIGLIYCIDSLIHKELAHKNEQIKADILQGNAPPVVIRGNCVDGKVYFLDDTKIPRAIFVGNDEPVECK